jgi:TrmH family RNA methyltransferase
MTLKAITSVHNQRVKDAIKLRDHRQRARQGRFLIDGARELLQAMRGRVRFLELFVCLPLCKSAESHEVVAQAGRLQADVWHVAPEVFEKMAYGHRHEGVLAVAETPHRTLADLVIAQGGLIAVLEGLEKPGNVGAVLRCADAAGVSAVVVADPRTDLYNPNCIRSSLGSIFTTPLCQATTSETLELLGKRGCKIFAARLDAVRHYTDVDLSGDAAIVLGSEASGLSDAWRTVEVTPVKLPMHGTADSLNVSATAAVLFYEAQRQRGKSRR